MWFRGWRPPAVIVAILAVHFILIQTEIGGPATSNLLANLIALAEPGVAAAACFWTARQTTGHARISWGLLGAGCLSWLLGQAAWTYYEDVRGIDVPFPSLADVGYLGFVPLVAAGTLVYSAPSLRGGDRVRFLLDGFLVVGSLLLLSWTSALDTAVLPAVTGVDALPLRELILLLAYPVGDVLIVAFVLLLLIRVPPGQRANFLLVGLGVTIFAVADTLFFLSVSAGTYATGNPIDLGWGAGQLVIGWAALRHAELGPTGQALRPSADRIVAFLPYVPLGFCVLAVVDTATESDGLSTPLLIVFVTLVAIVLVRQLYILFENQRLTRALEEQQAIRRQMLNNVAHDLRNPLTPMKLQLFALSQGRLPPEGVARAVEILERSEAQLERLVADLQDVSKVDSNALQLETCRQDVGAIVRQAAEGSREVAAQQGIAFDLRAELGSFAEVDAARITQVLQNLLSNAFKFTPSPGKVSVTAAREDGMVRVCVQDSGRGLDSHEMSRLFRPFSQVHDRSETKERGTGLGLYICKGIIEQHRGRIWVESDGRGKGSSFILELPSAS